MAQQLDLQCPCICLDLRLDLAMADRKAVIKNADMAEESFRGDRQVSFRKAV